MSNAQVETDLNQIITAAVQTRIEAQIASAFTNDGTFETFVIAALQQQIEIPDGTGYGKKRVPFLNHLIQSAVRDAAKLAVQKYMTAHTEELARAVERELSKRTDDIARQMVGRLSEKANDTYGMNVTLRWPGSN